MAVQLAFLLHVTQLLNIPDLFSSLGGRHRAINNYGLSYDSSCGKVNYFVHVAAAVNVTM